MKSRVFPKDVNRHTHEIEMAKLTLTDKLGGALKRGHFVEMSENKLFVEDAYGYYYFFFL